MCIGQVTDGMEQIGAQITDEDIAAEQLAAEIGNDIAPLGFAQLSPREMHAMMLKNKGIRGDALARKMETFDKARKITPEEEA